MSQTWHSRGGLNDLPPGERIALVIEPDRFKRAQAYALLRDRGYKTYNTGCGAVGQFMASQLSIDVIVLNAVLPDMNGLELLQRLRVRLPDAFIVATAIDDEDWESAVAEVSEAGADQVVRSLDKDSLNAALGERAPSGQDDAHPH